jgi:mannose-6-phosphate isomerase
MTTPYPLILEPIFKHKVWGGRRLERFGKALPDGDIGESWELADLGSTTPSGAGGEPARSRITNGPLAGKTLHDALERWGGDLLGDRAPTPAGDVPLLVKYLDAREHLSVQVHPSPAYAAAHADADLKTECWYVLDAEPGSKIFKGVRPGVTREQFEHALRHDPTACVALLEAVDAIPGQLHNLPSGTVHALGEGVLVAEVQTPSDTTYRVYDWVAEYGRPLRELHIDQALACIDFGPAPDAVRPDPVQPRAHLLDTEFFSVDVVRASSPTSCQLDGCVVVMQLAAESTINSTEPVALNTGQTAIVPAACAAQLDTNGESLLARL